MQNYKEAMDLAEQAADSDGFSDEVQRKYEDSLNARLAKLKASSQEIFYNMYNGNDTKVIIDGLSQILDLVSKIQGLTGTFPLLGGLLGGALAAKGGGFVNLDKDGLGGYKWTSILTKAPTVLKNGSEFSNILQQYNAADFDKSANSISGLTSNLSEASGAMNNYLNDLNGANASMQGFESYCANTGVALTTLGGSSKAAALGIQAINIATNTLLSMGISAGISLAVKGIELLVTRQKRLIESGKEAAASIKQSQTSYNDAAKTVNDYGKTYEQLSSGVELVNGKLTNISLSTDEYDRFLEANKALADTFPSIVSGFDSEGNAILNLGNNASSATEQLNGLLDAQRAVMRKEVLDEIPTQTKGVVEEVAKIQNNKSMLERDLEFLHYAENPFGQDFNAITQKDDGTYEITIGVYAETEGLEELEAEIEQVGYSIDKNQTLMFGVRDLPAHVFTKTVDSLEQAQQEYTALVERSGFGAIVNQNESDLKVYEQQIEEAYNTLIPSFESILTSNMIDDTRYFGDLSESLQNGLIAAFANVDIGKVISEGKFDLTTKTGAQAWISDWLSNFTGEDVEPLYEQFFELQGSKGSLKVKEYSSQVESLVSQIAKESNRKIEDVKIDLGLDTDITAAEKALNQFYSTLERHGTVLTDAEKQKLERQLTFDDIQIVYELVNKGMSFDNLQGILDGLNGYTVRIDFATANENNTALTNALSENTSGTGLTSETITALEKAYTSIYGYDSERLYEAFEYTAEGVQLNTDAIYELQAAQYEIVSTDYLSRLNYLTRQYGSVQSRISELGKTAGRTGDDTDALRSKLESQAQALKSEITDIQVQMAQLNALNSGYAKYKTATETPNEGHIYDDMQVAMKDVADLYEKGYVGDDRFTSFVDMMLGKPVREAGQSISDAYDEAYRNGLPTLNKYFTEDATGAQNFLEALDGLDDSLATVKKDASGEIIDFDVDNDLAAAEALGISLEAFQAILHKFSDYGWEVDIDDTPFMSKMDEMMQSTQMFKASIEETVTELTGEQFTLNLDSTSVNDINSQIRTVQAAKDALYDDQGNIKVGFSEADVESLNNTLASLVHQRNLLTQPAVMNVDTSQLSGELQTAMELIQSYISLEEQLKEAKVAGIDTSQIESQLSSVQQQITDLNNNSNIFVNLGFKTSTGEKLDFANGNFNQLFYDHVGNIDISGMPVFNRNQSSTQPDKTAVVGYKEEGFEEVAKHIEEIPDHIDVGVAFKFGSGSEKGAVKSDKGFSALGKGSTTTNVVNTKENKTTTSTKNEVTNKQTNVAIKTTGEDDAKSARNTLNSLPKQITPRVDVKTSGESRINNLRELMSKVKDVTANVSVTASGAGSLSNLINLMERIRKLKALGANHAANGTAHVLGTAVFHSAHVAGSAHVEGTAKARGDWSVRENQTALVGELGQELIIRDGHYMTVGDNGAEFVRLRQGDIVFNHRQTEELFKHGYVTSGGGRGKALVEGTAYAEGTAYSSGSGRFYGGAAKSYSSNLQSKKSTASANRVASAVNSAAEATEDFLDSLSNYFDYVAIKLKRVNEDTEKAIDAIEVAAGLGNKQAANSKALLATRTEIDVNREGYIRYMKQADMVAKETGLSTEIQRMVQNGAINISKYDENTKKAIDEYQKWVDAANDALMTVSELKKQERELAQERLDIIADYYDAVNGVKKSVQDLNESQINLNESTGAYSNVSGAIVTLLKDSMANEQTVYNNLKKEMNDYASELDSLVANGYIKKGSVEYFEAESKLNDLAKAANESALAINDFKKQLKELEYKQLQQRLDSFSRTIERLKNIEALNTAKGVDTAQSVYTNRIRQNNASIENLYAQRNKKINEMRYWRVDSTNYQEAAKQVAEWDSEIFNLLKDNEELEDQIRTLRWKPYEEIQKGLAYSLDELNDLRGLLNDDGFLDKNGHLTTTGGTYIALLGESISKSKLQVADYTGALKALDKELASGMISKDQYKEQQLEILTAIRDSVSAINDYRNALIDLYKEQLQAEVDALQKTIDKRKDALKARKEYADYDKDIRTSQKQVNILKAQIAALNGVTNAEALAQRKRLEAQLAEAEEGLQDKRDEHRYTIEIEGLESIGDNLNETLENTLFELSTNADKQEQVVRDMLSNIKTMYKDVYAEINDILKDTGIQLYDKTEEKINLLKTGSGANTAYSNAVKSQEATNKTNTSKTITNMATSKVNTGTATTKAAANAVASSTNKAAERKIAQISVSPSSLSLQVGKSGKITTAVTPSDAKNKTIKWTTSNAKVATVSGGTVKGVGAGSATITATAADGGGAKATVKVTVTKPATTAKKTTTTTTAKTTTTAPKTTTTTAKTTTTTAKTTSSSSTAKTTSTATKSSPPFVKQKFSGSKSSLSPNYSIVDRLAYYDFAYDMASRKKLYDYWNGSSKYGAYSGTATQNTWLISMMKSVGYKTGTRNASAGLHKINELGKELTIRYAGNDYTVLSAGDQVLKANLSNRIFDMAEHPSKFIAQHMPNITSNAGNIIQVNYDNMINIEGNATPETVVKLQDMIPEITDRVTKSLVREYRKMN